MSRKRPTTDLDLLRGLGYAVGWSSSPMDEPFRLGAGVVVLDGTRPTAERWAAAEWAAALVLDEADTP